MSNNTTVTRPKMIQVAEGELYVFGKLISRHPDKPWLFSITDVYKACEAPIKKEAIREGKNPETAFKNKQPGPWVRDNLKSSLVDATAKKLRNRIRRYGIGCGFGLEPESNLGIPRLDNALTNREICLFSVKGGSAKAKVHGTYVAQDFIVDYAGFLNAKLKASINDTFISVLNGYTEEVTKKVEENSRIAKGTEARETNKALNHRLAIACGRKSILPINVHEGINESTLGLNATQYKRKFGIKEPFNDNITEAQVDLKNVAVSLSTLRINNHVKAKLNSKEGRVIGRTSGDLAKFVFANHAKLIKLATKNMKD